MRDAWAIVGTGYFDRLTRLVIGGRSEWNDVFIHGK